MVAPSDSESSQMILRMAYMFERHIMYVATGSHGGGRVRRIHTISLCTHPETIFIITANIKYVRL
jgi:hypothetical protein